MEPVRLNKFLSEIGVCSRREADRMIEQGLVLVNGKAAEAGMKVDDSCEISVKGEIVSGRRQQEILLAVHKPVGVICTTDRREKRNIVDYVGYPTRIYPIGRLDKDSEGLILMTNNGDLVNRIMKASTYHEKEYIVSVDKPITDTFLEKMRSGVRIKKVESGKVIMDEITRPCTVEKIGKQKFRIILTQGLNRQIRRMCETLGFKVEKLQRVRIMNIDLKGLPIGHYREIVGDELAALYAQLYQQDTKED